MLGAPWRRQLCSNCVSLYMCRAAQTQSCLSMHAQIYTDTKELCGTVQECVYNCLLFGYASRQLPGCSSRAAT